MTRPTAANARLANQVPVRELVEQYLENTLRDVHDSIIIVDRNPITGELTVWTRDGEQFVIKVAQAP